jgi:hypothetical protein
MKKPEVGKFYKNMFGHIFKVIHIDETLELAVVEWMGEDCKRTWDYRRYPEHIKRKLTPLEVELL